MLATLEGVWRRLEQWSSIGFAGCGVGFLMALALLVADSMGVVSMPEMVISVVVVPSMLLLSVVGLPGFYGYLADASPRLALSGAIAATVAGLSVIVTSVGKIGLDLLGIIGFTEEGPLLAGFFLFLIGFFLSVLLYGVASARTGEPSRLVGILLLVIVVEPALTLVNDLVGIDIGISVAFASLGIAGIALVLIGYLLHVESTPGSSSEPTPETAA